MKQGGGYHVYADASDASAVASVTANVSTVTTGQTAVPLPACVSGCTVGGHTYGFKSALLTASTPLAQGAQELHGRRGGRRRQHELAGELQRAGGQHGPVACDGDRGDDGDESAGLREAGRDVPRVCERERPAVGRGQLLGRRPRDPRRRTCPRSAPARRRSRSRACGSCGPARRYAYQSAQLTADAVLSEGNKLYSVSAADNLGTSATSSGANVQVDNTGPSLATVIAATTGTNPQGFVKQGGTYRVYANASDLPSGAGNFSGVDLATLRPTCPRSAPARRRSRSRPAAAAARPRRYAYQSAQLTADAVLSGGEQALLGVRGRQPGHELDLLGRERAGGQHGPVAGDGDRGDDGDEPAGLREAGRDVPRVCERERSAVGCGQLLGRRTSRPCRRTCLRSAPARRRLRSRPAAAAARPRRYAYQSAQLTADAVLVRGEQAVLGVRGRQPGHELDLLGRERAGGQHGAVRLDRHREHDDEPARLAQAGRRLPRLRERHGAPGRARRLERPQRVVDHRQRLERHHRPDGRRADDEPAAPARSAARATRIRARRSPRATRSPRGARASPSAPRTTSARAPRRAGA